MDADNYPTIMHIDIDAFFASVEEAICPALHGQPVIVGGLPTGRGVVACPNYEARKLGVRTAMPIAKAYALAPHAVFMKGSYPLYEKYSRKFIEILQKYSPMVRPVSLDEAYVDINGCLHIWNFDPYAVARAIKRAVLDELGISVSIGIAANRICAKVASDYSKKVARADMESRGQTGPPNGLLVVPLGSEKEFLAPLPVSSIPGIGKRTDETLRSLGILTVADLARMDTAVLKDIFGTVGCYLHTAANGKGSRALEDDGTGAKSISRSTTFHEDSGDEEFISSVFFYLSEKIARELRQNKEAASTITAKMRYSDGAPLLSYRKTNSLPDGRFVTYQKSHTLDEPTNSEFKIASTGYSLFKSLWLEGTKVRLVGIGVTNIGDERRQLGLFPSNETERQGLLTGVDKIREKFGYHSIYFGIVERLMDEYGSDHRDFDMHTSPAREA